MHGSDFFNLSLSLSLALLAVPFARAQDDAASPPAAVQETIRQWVEVQERISAEESAWEEERQILADLNELRRREMEKLDESIATSESRVRHFQSRQGELAEERRELRADRDGLLEQIGPLEERTRALLKTFPPPLLDKLGTTVERLEEAGPDRPLQERYRDVIAVLLEAGTFHDKITVDTELRTIGDRETEVEILYLGLGRAYYVTRQGNEAGIGVPADDGWTWTETPRLASDIRKTIAVHRQEAPPSLVRLPVQVDDKAP